jgi:hypothetical protein
VQHLRSDWSPDAAPSERIQFAQRSVGFAISQDVEGPALLRAPIRRDPQGTAAGFAWVLRRQLLDRHGLYDGCITGGGDTALACAAWGVLDAVVDRHAMNAHQERYYREWAQPFSDEVRGSVGCLDGDLFHLWHGNLAHRQASDRHLTLRPFAFDPVRDIEHDESGCWRWSSDKPGLHASMREYFAARKEDG